jgi:hypothetical protein
MGVREPEELIPVERRSGGRDDAAREGLAATDNQRQAGRPLTLIRIGRAERLAVLARVAAVGIRVGLAVGLGPLVVALVLAVLGVGDRLRPVEGGSLAVGVGFIPRLAVALGLARRLGRRVRVGLPVAGDRVAIGNGLGRGEAVGVAATQVKLAVPPGRKPPAPIVSPPTTESVWPPVSAPVELPVPLLVTPETPDAVSWS